MAKFLFTKGHIVSEETKKKISLSKVGKKRPNMTGAKHFRYNGGLPLCIRCSKKLSTYGGQLCKSCVNRGELNRNYKGGQPKCLDCEKIISYHAKRCKSCGQKNRDPQTRVMPKGINHPNYGKKHSLETRKKISLNRRGKGKGASQWKWKGGVTTNDKLQRATFRITMQKSIFERDGYSCQLCGSKKDLQVDHIQSWADYVELRFSMDNCRTLCAKCHYKITFGREMPMTVKGWGHNLLRGINP